jgi:hypothetical protein
VKTNNVVPFRPRQPRQPKQPQPRKEQRELSPSDHALVLAVIAHHGWSYDEARERLELLGM